MFNPLVWVADRDIKKNWPQYWALRYTTCKQLLCPLSFLWEEMSWCFKLQPLCSYCKVLEKCGKLIGRGNDRKDVEEGQILWTSHDPHKGERLEAWTVQWGGNSWEYRGLQVHVIDLPSQNRANPCEWDQGLHHIWQIWLQILGLYFNIYSFLKSSYSPIVSAIACIRWRSILNSLSGRMEGVVFWCYICWFVKN